MIRVISVVIIGVLRKGHITEPGLSSLAPYGFINLLNRFRRYYTPRLGTALIGLVIFLLGVIVQEAGFFVSSPESVARISISLYFLAYVFSGYYLFISAVKGLRKLTLSYPFLMVSAGASAFILGSYAEGAAILILMTLGEWLEEAAGKRVRESLFKLYNELPKQVCIIRNAMELMIPVEEIRKGDLVLVRAGEVVPIDGVVKEGGASLDVSSVKGEFYPEIVGVDSRVLAGSVNLDGFLKILAETTYEASTVSRLYQAIAQALKEKGSYERFFERFSRYYSPLVVVIAILFFLGAYAVLGWSAEKAFYSALVFVVVSCPCAFILSTPVATASAMAGSSKRGILIRGSSVLERLNIVKALALDKTGTLTQPEISLSSITLIGDIPEKEVLSYALQLEQSSNHPIAKALRTYAIRNRFEVNGTQVEEVHNQVGGGVEGLVNKKHICIGSLDFVNGHHSYIEDKLESQTEGIRQKAHVVMILEDKPVALFFFEEKLREGAREIKQSFAELGIGQVALLSGDRRENVEKLASTIGITDIYAELTPEEKLTLLREMRQKHGAIAMVGDGINDSAVLAGADVGIAMNTVGNDMVLEGADVVVASEDLFDIPKVFKLGKLAVKTIRVNTAIALIGKFGFAIIALILAYMGVKSLWIAVIGDDGLTLLVILNSIKLLRFMGTKG